MNPEAAYRELLTQWRKASLFRSAEAVLEWEQQTYMPPRGTEHRGDQLALLAGCRHDCATDPRIGDLLGELESSSWAKDELSPAAVNLREIRREYDRQTKLPKALVEELARTTAQAQREWAEARRNNDFPRFLPWLDKVFDLTRQKAAALDPDKPPYDVLMDEFEPGANADAVAQLFRDLRRPLVDLVSAVAGAKRRPDDAVLARTYPVDRQKFFGEMAAGEIGFDFQRGRLDETVHPFCATLGPHDCRITTRYNPRRFNEAFFGILHETGHGLYEQGLDVAHFGEPMGEAASLGVHESQSRLWENAVGRGLPFWRRFFPRARALFRDALADVSLDQFHCAVNKVAPSLVRVEADEVTYNLHVLIRFELERALVLKDLAPQGLPAAWNEKYREYLGIAPLDDASGCLQDVHWSHGLIGYFPTYTLGNVYAAQLWDKADADLGGLDEILQRGEFRVLLDWLRERVHRHGKRFLPERLMREATGSPPSAAALVRSLRRKFEPLYDL